jgi:hypothetical protein
MTTRVENSLRYSTDYADVTDRLKDRTVWEDVRNIAESLRKMLTIAVELRSDPDAPAETYFSGSVTDAAIFFECGFLLEKLVPLGMCGGLIDEAERPQERTTLPWNVYGSIAAVAEKAAELLRDISSDESLRITSRINEFVYSADSDANKVCKIRLKGYGGRWRTIIGSGAMRFPSNRRMRDLIAVVDVLIRDAGEFLQVIESHECTSGEPNGETLAPPVESQTPEERALALLVAHPEWSDTQIAKKVGVSRTSVYRWERFKAARKAMRTTESIPKGTKNGKTGDIEAWSDDE